MAQYPKIRIEVASVPTVDGASLYIRLGTLESQSYYILLNSSLTAPAGFMKYYVGLTTSACKQNILSALTAAYGAPFIFESVDGIDAIDISVESYELGDLTASIQNESDFNVTITPVIPPIQFSITGITYSQATDKCNNIKASATVKDAPQEGDFVVKAIYNGSTQETKITTDEADFFFDFPRYSTGSRKIEIISGADVTSIDVGIVKRVLSIDVLIAYSVGGATITINPNQSAGTVNITPFQFSIDDIVFQASNVFEIAVSGNFTAYVVDNYGCKKSVAFSVDLEERKGAPYFDIEITNPLHLVDQNITGIKNISNQLSADYDIPNVEDRFFRQPFKIGDIIRTQFKSNYSSHEVRVYNCGNLIETITPVLKIENTNRLDKRDAVLHTGAPNKTNVAFTQGNIYDPITNTVIDTYFQYDGRLPSFVRVGMLLTFNDPTLTGTFEVEEIIFDERLQSWVAVITATRLRHETAVQVLSAYNLEEYNIYEFELTYPEGQYHIEVVATDDNALYPDVLWESEPFFFSDDIEVVTIDYSSNVNQSLIDYRTDIEFRLCVPGRFAKYQPTTESETFKDDLGNLYLQKNTYNRMWEVETSLIPWWLAEKLIIASKHKILKIDGISVVNSETPEVTDRLGERNPFYQVIGMYQENIDISVTDETGIISGARGILGGNENQVIGI